MLAELHRASPLVDVISACDARCAQQNLFTQHNTTPQPHPIRGLCEILAKCILQTIVLVHLVVDVYAQLYIYRYILCIRSEQEETPHKPQRLSKGL